MKHRHRFLNTALISTAALALVAASASAQPAAEAAAPAAPARNRTPVGPFPPVAAPAKLDDVVVKGPMAVRAKERSMLRLDVAERIAKACFAQAVRNNQNVTVYIIDQAGNLIYAARQDGQHPVNIETAEMKAKGALYLREPTHVVMNRSIENMMNELRMMQLGVFPNQGALPIIVENQLLGAIGVGGGAQDEPCAHEALQTVLGPQPPMAPVLPPKPR